MKKKHVWLFLYLFIKHLSFAQDVNVDSLISIVAKAPDDTNKLKNLSAISDNAPDGVWQKYNELMGKISKQLTFDSNKEIARFAKKVYAMYLNNKGYEYTEKGDFKTALDFYTQSEKIYLVLGDSAALGLIYSSTGAIYDRQNDPEKAILRYRSALTYNKAAKADRNTMATLNNLGGCFTALHQYDSSLVCFLEALKIAEKNKYKNQIVTVLLASVGEKHRQKGEFQKAIDYYERGSKMAIEIGDNQGKTSNLWGLSKVYLQSGDLQKALTFGKQSYDASLRTGIYSRHNAAYNLKMVYERLGETANAYKMYKLEIQYSDSLKRIENQKGVIHHQFETEYALKEVKQKAEQEKKDVIARDEMEKQKLLRNGFIGGFLVVLLFAGVFFTQRNKISREKKRSEELLLNILPSEVAEELKEKGSAEAKLIDDVTVLFTDFKGFTSMSELLSPKDLVKDIHDCFSAFDIIMEKYGMEKIKTIGDSYMAAGGLPSPNTTHALDAVNAAIEIAAFIERGKTSKIAEGKPYFEIRLGIHTGPVVAGIVGIKKFAYDIWGDTVNIASRMESSGEVGKVNISSTTFELVKDRFNCVHRGKVGAKGKGEIDMYFVT